MKEKTANENCGDSVLNCADSQFNEYRGKKWYQFTSKCFPGANEFDCGFFRCENITISVYIGLAVNFHFYFFGKHKCGGKKIRMKIVWFIIFYGEKINDFFLAQSGDVCTGIHLSAGKSQV